MVTNIPAWCFDSLWCILKFWHISSELLDLAIAVQSIHQGVPGTSIEHNLTDGEEILTSLD